MDQAGLVRSFSWLSFRYLERSSLLRFATAKLLMVCAHVSVVVRGYGWLWLTRDGFDDARFADIVDHGGTARSKSGMLAAGQTGVQAASALSDLLWRRAGMSDSEAGSPSRHGDEDGEAHVDFGSEQEVGGEGEGCDCRERCGGGDEVGLRVTRWTGALSFAWQLR